MESLLRIFYRSWKLQNVNTRYRQTSPFRRIELTRHVDNIPVIPAVRWPRQENNKFEASKGYNGKFGPACTIYNNTLSQKRKEGAESVAHQNTGLAGTPVCP